MVIIEKSKYRDNHCLSCHDKISKVFDVRIKHNEYSSTVIALCEKCLEELKQKIEEVTSERNS